MWLLVPLILYCLLAQKLFYRGGLAVSFVFVAFIIGLFITIVSDPLGDISFILLLTAGFFFMAHLHQQDVQFVERAAPRVLDFLEDISHFCPDCWRDLCISYMENANHVEVSLTIINEEEAQRKRDYYNNLIDANLDYDNDIVPHFFDHGYRPKNPDLCMDLLGRGKMEEFGLQYIAFLLKGGNDTAVHLLANKVRKNYPNVDEHKNTSGIFSVSFRR